MIKRLMRWFGYMPIRKNWGPEIEEKPTDLRFFGGPMDGFAKIQDAQVYPRGITFPGLREMAMGVVDASVPFGDAIEWVEYEIDHVVFRVKRKEEE